MRVIALITILLASAVICTAQTAVLLPLPRQCFNDTLSSGKPLAGGFIYTCTAGLSCPGNPLARFTDSTGLVPNTNPVVMDSAGCAAIWITPATAYKLVAQNSSGVQEWTADNVTGLATTVSGSFFATTATGFSATPVFTSIAQNQLFKMTLIGNVTSSTLSMGGLLSPALVTFEISQDATGGRTFVFPTNTYGAPPIASCANCTTEDTFSWDGTTAILTSSQVVNGGAGTLTAVAAAITAANVNKTIYVDGTTYPLTATGIQSAITAACNGTVLGSVVIPPGTISLGTTGLSVPNNCDVSGAGQAVTKLTFTSGATTTFFGNSAGSPSNIRIHDMTLDGGSGTSYNEGCVTMNVVSSPTDITVENISCQNVGGTAINVSGSTGNLGNRVKVIRSKVLNACLNTFSPGVQCYGLLLSNNSHTIAQDNEVSGGNVTAGIVAFSATNASAATPVVDVQFLGNRIHDISETITTGGAMDIGRVRQAVISNNTIYNIVQGGCAFFEAVWGGTISDNACSVADSVSTGGPIAVFTPDTTQSGEVASQDISIVGNTIVDNSAIATTNGGITLNGAVRNIVIKGNSISYVNQATSFPAAILLQLGRNDSNLIAAGQNFCNGVIVEGNTITNRHGASGASVTGISLQQITSVCTADQIVIANNVVVGANLGLQYAAAVNSGITNAYIHDNSLNATTSLAGDAKTYTSLFAWNNGTPSVAGILGTTTVAGLPAAASNTGAMLRVSDSTAIAAEGQTCAGGSTNNALAFSNGSVWKCF